MHTIRIATLADVPHVAANLRQADRDEIQAVGWMPTPVDALVHSIEASVHRWVALDSAGLPAVLFGCAAYPDIDGVGCPWLLGTSYIETAPIETLRQARRYLVTMHKSFPALHQFVDARNTIALGWMEWLGFKMERVLPRWGVEKRPFIHYSRLRHV